MPGPIALRHLGGDRWSAVCRLCTYESEAVLDYGAAGDLADAHMAVMHSDLDAPEVYVDTDELWAVYQAMHFTAHIPSLDAETQDLLEDMQNEALELLGDLVPGALDGPTVARPTALRKPVSLSREQLQGLLDTYMVTRDSARAAAVERTPASHAADDAAHQAMVRALFALVQ